MRPSGSSAEARRCPPKAAPGCTFVELRRDAGGGMIRIPFIEGEHARADRNGQIGRLEVAAARVDAGFSRRPRPVRHSPCRLNWVEA